MLTAAIIAEYNPFHHGHAFHLAQTRAAGATHVVAVMGGNFTQRGSVAVAEKRVRARAALASGCDLVLELPLPYALGSAQHFAFGAVGVILGLGCVDMLSFGSESGYLSILQAAARAVDSPELVPGLQGYLSEGMTFARARQLAVRDSFGDEVADMLSTPNDLLAVEYLRQLLLSGSQIEPFAVRREGPGHDSRLPFERTASASYLRGLWKSGTLQDLQPFLPGGSYQALAAGEGEGLCPAREERLEAPILAQLRRMEPGDYRPLPDVTEGLENRIYNAVRQAASLQQVYEGIKSKRYTAARIRRIVMAAFLELPGTLCTQPPPYIRVLGFNSRGAEILAQARRYARLPISDSLASLRRLGGRAEVFARLEAMATDLYSLALPRIFPCGYDYTAGSVRLL